MRTRIRPNGVILVGSVSGLLTGLDPNPDFPGAGYGFFVDPDPANIHPNPHPCLLHIPVCKKVEVEEANFDSLLTKGG